MDNEEHIFKPKEDDKDYCVICEENFRSLIHVRADFVRCSSCGTPWESELAATTCPCWEYES